jgi:hypothetical protein
MYVGLHDILLLMILDTIVTVLFQINAPRYLR